jgi:hypothetical protein
MTKPIEIIVGRGNVGDPVVGASSVSIPSLAGQDAWVEYQGYGPMKYEDYQVLPGGGFAFTNVSRVFATGDAYFIHAIGLSRPQAGQYSNGFQLQNVLNALTGRLGWLPPTQSGVLAIASPNTISNSGRYFNDGSFHAIVDPYIIQQVQPDTQITATNFNALLLRLQQSAILRALNGVFNKREILERKLLFERFGRQDYPDIPQQVPTFVGVRLTAPRDFDRSMQVDSITLFFNGSASFNFYLFHDTQPGSPVATIQVTAIGGQQTVINLNQFTLNYSQFNKSGYYYLGYFQKDLPAGITGMNEIIEKFNDMFEFGAVPIELPQLPIGPGISLNNVDVNQVSFTIKTHGFNLQLSAFRDHTQSILMSPYLFDELIGLEVAAMTLEMVNTSYSSNKIERIAKDLTAFLWKDLNADESKGTGDFQPVVAGLKKMIQREITRVKNEFYPRQKVETIMHDTERINPYGTPVDDAYRY